MLPPTQSGLPPALTALDAYPWVREPVETSLAQQGARVVERTMMFQGRRSVLAALDSVLHAGGSGLVALEGPPGSGVTSLLAHLAATHPAAFWFYDDDAGEGCAALCAQLIGLHRLPVALVPPAAHNDPTVLATLLGELSSIRDTRTSDENQPILILIDPPGSESQPREPLALPPLVLPPVLPPNTLVVYGCQPGATLPHTPIARIAVPTEGEESIQDQQAMLHALDCPDDWVSPLLDAAQGTMLYLTLAYGLLQRDVLKPPSLPAGLDALYDQWWAQLAPHEQELALLLAAAGEPVPAQLCATITGTDPHATLEQWGPLVVKQVVGARSYDSEHGEAEPSLMLSWYHWTTTDFLARTQATALEQTHAALVERSGLSDGKGNSKGDGSPPPETTATGATAGYLSRQASRHAALGTSHTRNTVLPRVAQRDWVRAQERHSGSLREAARDLAWEVHVAATTPVARADVPTYLVRLGRGLALAGTLASQARTLSPDTAVAALRHAIAHQKSRDTSLKQVLDVVEQLPDGQHKALVLRQLGEACYAERMRTSAMRLLSQALDLEEKRLPTSWREHHDRLLVDLVQAAITLKAVDAALHISEHISHPEQRGMAETHIVRFLLTRKDREKELVRARKIATAIAHESLGAWALAEVVAAVAQDGDLYTAEMLLSDIKTDTAFAWARIELACLIVGQDEQAAREQVMQLESVSQRDHGLARLAHALAKAGKENESLALAAQIGDPTVRVAALLDVRHALGNLVALLALKQANTAIQELSRDEQVPLVTLLASAYASGGHQKQALAVAEQLPEGEERDRALSRVAVALARGGNQSDALAIAQALPDDDERDWTFGELTGVLVEQGHWQEAQSLALKIRDDKDRARTLANLAIALARTGAALAALWPTRSIGNPAERGRALTIIAPLLVRNGHKAEALDSYQNERRKTAEQQPDSLSPEQLGRYLTAIATTLAETGHHTQAHELLTSIYQPFDRARVLLALAQNLVARDPVQACALSGRAAQLALFERSLAYRLLEDASPVLAQAGKGITLKQLAETIDELDSWW